MGILDKVKSLFRGPPTSEQVDSSIYQMSLQLSRLDQVYDRLKRREREIFEKVVEAQVAHDTEKARVYSVECGEVRKILDRVLTSKLSLEQAILRLRISQRISDLLSGMKNVNKIIKSARVKVAEFPLLMERIAEIDAMLAQTIPEERRVPVPLEEHARIVLDQAKAVAEERVAELFPKVPIELPVLEAEKQIEAPQISTASSEKDVHDYLKALGEIDIDRCASDLGYAIEQVEKIISKLKEEGKL